MSRLFGTDGVRGIANTELSNELAAQIGRAAAYVLTKEIHGKPRVVIGADTRKSSDMLFSSIAAGLCSVGADVVISGVLPTPAVAYLVKKHKFDAGIMISASHNPCEYNGVKIFKSDGYKLPDSLEEEIERIILDDALQFPAITGGDIGRIKINTGMADEYIERTLKIKEFSKLDLKIAVDCANGSACATAKKLFSHITEKFYCIFDNPNGININKNCGSTHIDALSDFVVRNSCDIGFAFDGDADRLLTVDHSGALVDGDKFMAIAAKYLKSQGKLKNDAIAATAMSNMGLFKFCRDNGIKCEKAGVGDRYVLEMMLKEGFNFGGEQSGHIIFRDHSTTGDGQLSAVMLLNVLAGTGKTLNELAGEIEIFPQILINVRVSAYGKHRLETDGEIINAVLKAEEELGDEGRVLVRASGTEPLVRVMLEGRDSGQIERLAKDIAGVVEERLI
ncbi:MAG: phosphoglucosamine mutase [Oscillospiraceae bacterium]|nr:phosphoglucosamine mutase [Oscillospiraceae bacterium]